MNGIQSVGSFPGDIQQMMQRRLSGGGMPEGMDGMRAKMEGMAKGVQHSDGQSLYEMKDAIFASVQDAVGDSNDPADFRGAMDQALRDNGFDPEALRAEMKPPGGGRFGGVGAFGGPGGFGGGFGDASALFGDPGSANADAMMQELLAMLPAGSTLYEQV